MLLFLQEQEIVPNNFIDRSFIFLLYAVPPAIARGKGARHLLSKNTAEKAVFFVIL
jgi:hypothetical protein